MWVLMRAGFWRGLRLGVIELRGRFQLLDFFGDEGGDAVFEDVDLVGANAEGGGNVFDGPLFKDVAVEDLEMFGIYLGFHALDGGIEELALPFVVPNGVEFQGR